MIKVLLADDQALVREAFALMLSVEDDIELVARCATGREALEAAASMPVDVCLLDIEMPAMDGIEATRQIRNLPNPPHVVILTTFDRDDYLFSALRAGAQGFMLKNTKPELLVEGIRNVAAGGSLLAPEVTRRVIMQAVSQPPSESAADPRLQRLTPREREVLIAMARGLNNQEIAEQLCVSETTVKTHVSACFTKLDVRDRVQAVIFAFENGLLT